MIVENKILKIGVIHTVTATISIIKNMFNDDLAYIEIINVFDDSLLKSFTSREISCSVTTRKVMFHLMSMRESNVDLIISACSSIGDVVESLGFVLDLPVIRIDRPMAEKAISFGGPIAVLATLQSTFEPTLQLLESVAKNNAVNEHRIDLHLCEGAFDYLSNGNKDMHDSIIQKKIISLVKKDYSCIILAQASMESSLNNLPEINIPVLSSPRSMCQYIKNINI